MTIDSGEVLLGAESKMEHESPIGRIPLKLKVVAEGFVALGGLLYACGFVIVTIHLASYGVLQHSLLKVRYIVVGFPFALFVSVILLAIRTGIGYWNLALRKYTGWRLLPEILLVLFEALMVASSSMLVFLIYSGLSLQNLAAASEQYASSVPDAALGRFVLEGVLQFLILALVAGLMFLCMGLVLEVVGVWRRHLARKGRLYPNPPEPRW
jgi:hypothetical protein